MSLHLTPRQCLSTWGSSCLRETRDALAECPQGSAGGSGKVNQARAAACTTVQQEGFPPLTFPLVMRCQEFFCN